MQLPLHDDHSSTSIEGWSGGIRFASGRRPDEALSPESKWLALNRIDDRQGKTEAFTSGGPSMQDECAPHEELMGIAYKYMNPYQYGSIVTVDPKTYARSRRGWQY